MDSVSSLAARVLQCSPQMLAAPGFSITDFTTCDGPQYKLLETAENAPVIAFVDVEHGSRAGGAVQVIFQQLPALGLIVTVSTDQSPVVHRRNFSTGETESVFDQNAAFKGKLPTSETVDQLEADDHRFEAFLFSAHSTLRDIDGMHPDEALEELCKLLELKLYDERRSQLNQGTEYFSRRAMPADAIAANLRQLALNVSSASTIPVLLRASSPALASIARSLSRWCLTRINADIRGRAFQKVLGTTFRAELGQYFTPTPIVELLVAAVDPRPGESILDPFCGSGHFLGKAVQHVARTGDGLLGAARVCGLEINERMVRVARIDSEFAAQSQFEVQQANSLMPFPTAGSLRPGSFDVVVTNPPFGSAVSAEASHRLGPFSLARGQSTPLEILGLERSIEFLRPGGRLAIVLPEGILTNQRLKYVRDWLSTILDVCIIVSFPRSAFAPLGANIATCAIMGIKKGGEAQRAYPNEVLSVVVDSVGYDASGRSCGDSEVEDVKRVIADFIGRESR